MKKFNEPVNDLPICDPSDVKSGSQGDKKIITLDQESKFHPRANLEEEKAFLRYVSNDPQFESKALSRFEDPAGGYILNERQFGTFMEELYKINEMMGLVNVLPMANTAKLTIKSFNLSPTIVKVSDVTNIVNTTNSTLNTDSDIFGKQDITPHDRAGSIKIPVNLLRDTSYPLESKINEAFSRAFAASQEEDIIQGNGVGGAKGFLECLAVTSGGVAGGQNNYDVANAYDTTTLGITPEDINGVRFKLAKQYRRSAACRLIIPTTTLSAIMDFRENSDGADTGAFMWQPVFIAGMPPQLRGMPYVEVEDADWPTWSGDGYSLFAYGDLSRYIYAEGQSINVQRLLELYAETRQIGILYTMAWDGVLTDSKAIVRFNRNA